MSPSDALAAAGAVPRSVTSACCREATRSFVTASDAAPAAFAPPGPLAPRDCADDPARRDCADDPARRNRSVHPGNPEPGGRRRRCGGDRRRPTPPGALRRFWRDESGAAFAVEVILFSGLMAFTCMMLFAFWEAYRIRATAGNATYVISDMISREGAPINDAYITGMGRVFS